MTTLGIVGELTFEPQQMECVDFEMETVRQIMEECVSINPKDISWSSVDRNTWFVCINTLNNKGYWFPICESENSEQNYKRPKEGMVYFKGLGWKVYKVQ